jgi:para-nitrobenzyl esterase
MVLAQTYSGTIRGREADGVSSFRGIPFAAPPIGPLRWARPQPVEPWVGERDATAFAKVAVQTIDSRAWELREEQSEDCLYLNVWTTTTDAEALQPVMVWIHGGGFLNGSGSVDWYDGTELAKRGVTVINLNYRLGAFGFLVHPDTGTNFAVLDWVAALKWVAGNARSFGGDPANVTVFGQSAGAAAVRALLSTPAARGLFHRGVIQSAGFDDYAYVESPSFERSRAASERMFETLGTSDIASLRGLPAEDVRLASLANSGIFPPEGQVHTPANLTWYPVIDGDIIPTGGTEFWPDDLPVVFGTVADESRFFVAPTFVYAHPELDPAAVYSRATLGQMADRLGGSASGKILAYYDDSGLSAYEAIAELISAAVWFEPALATLNRLADLGKTLYYYRFARISPGALASGSLAMHSAEIPYLFGHVAAEGGYDDTDLKVSDAVQTAWIEFARSGVPRNPDGSAWPRYESKHPMGELIDETSRAEAVEIEPVTALIGGLR